MASPERNHSENQDTHDEAQPQKVPDRKPAGMRWGSFIEARIREAQDGGAFDNLPGFGKPIPSITGQDDEDWWLKEKARRENINLLPPALKIKLDVERTLQRVDTLVYEADVRRTLEALNKRIVQAQRAAVWGPPCNTQQLDIEAAVAQWRTKREG